MNYKSYKEIIESAISKEIEANTFYTDISNLVKDPILIELFASLASDEKKHEKSLRSIMNNDKNFKYFKENKDYQITESIEDTSKLSSKMKPSDAISLAMHREYEAMQQYKSLSDSCNDLELKQLFLNLSKMEQGHKVKLEKTFMDLGYPEVW